MKLGAIIIGIFVVVIVISGGLFLLSGDEGKSIDVNPNGVSIDEADSLNGFDNVDENNEVPLGTIDEDVQPDSEPTEEPTEEPVEEPVDPSVEGPFSLPHPYTVEFNDGYTPSTLTIKLGDSVVFINKDSSTTWPASTIHPTHTVYPGSGISKCNTEEESTIFDACKGLEQDEEYTFEFNEAGTWNYHDHLKPARTGTIIVE